MNSEIEELRANIKAIIDNLGLLSTTEHDKDCALGDIMELVSY